jgi:hypothetical protein
MCVHAGDSGGAVQHIYKKAFYVEGDRECRKQQYS